MKKQHNQTIKAHLIRSAFYVLLLVVVCVIPFALAQRNASDRSITTRLVDRNVTFNAAAAPSSTAALQAERVPTANSGSIGIPWRGTPLQPNAPQMVLYDQYDNASDFATLSATFSDFPPFNSDLADDFVVPTGVTWNVQSIDADGVYVPFSGPANTFNVFFYADNAGLPGAQIYSAINQPFSVMGTTFSVTLPSVAVLTQGTYWVEIQANMTFIPNGAWFWRDRTLQANNGAAWQNPGGGFGVCPTWAQKTTCIPLTGGPDQVFRLNGTTGGGTPTPTPTSSPTATPSATPSATASPSATPTATPSSTPTATPTPSGTPAVCVRGLGYWKNHPNQWPVTELQLGNVTYTEEQLLSILREPVRGNGLVSLAHHLIAAKLNIASGANAICIIQIIANADALIGDLVIPPVGDGYLAPRDIEALKDMLEDYNEGRLCAPSCDQGLGNISTRAFVQTGDNVMIGGFIVEGTTPKRVIIRAIGPELVQYGITDALANPRLELHNGTGALIASNDNWQTTIPGGIITSNQVSDIQKSGHAPTAASESAIIADLRPGNYTAIIRDVNNTNGVGLVEVYDLSPGVSSTLGNISTRSFVQTGEHVMIGGFIVQGSRPKRVIIRAIGPELTQYGVPAALADPTLELHDGTGALIASNDNWHTTVIGGIITSDQFAGIQNSDHAPGDRSEAAIVATLRPGNYTAIVRGKNNTTGVALVEVYDLN